MSLDFFRAAGVQPCVEGHYRCVFQKGQLDDRFEARGGDSIACDVDRLDVLIVTESLLQTFGEGVSELVAGEYDLAQAALVQKAQAFMVNYVRLVL